jgi:hypothetical protein
MDNFFPMFIFRNFEFCGRYSTPEVGISESWDAGTLEDIFSLPAFQFPNQTTKQPLNDIYK